jgi:hypothetical protein
MRRQVLKVAAVGLGAWLLLNALLVGCAARARHRLLSRWNAMTSEERVERFADPLYCGGKWRPLDKMGAMFGDCPDGALPPAGAWYVDVLHPLSPYNVVEYEDRRDGRSFQRWRLTTEGWKIEALLYVPGM